MRKLFLTAAMISSLTSVQAETRIFDIDQIQGAIAPICKDFYQDALVDLTKKRSTISPDRIKEINGFIEEKLSYLNETKSKPTGDFLAEIAKTEDVLASCEKCTPQEIVFLKQQKQKITDEMNSSRNTIYFEGLLLSELGIEFSPREESTISSSSFTHTLKRLYKLKSRKDLDLDTQRFVLQEVKFLETIRSETGVTESEVNHHIKALVKKFPRELSFLRGRVAKSASNNVILDSKQLKFKSDSFVVNYDRKENRITSYTVNKNGNVYELTVSKEGRVINSKVLKMEKDSTLVELCQNSLPVGVDGFKEYLDVDQSIFNLSYDLNRHSVQHISSEIQEKFNTIVPKAIIRK